MFNSMPFTRRHSLFLMAGLLAARKGWAAAPVVTRAALAPALYEVAYSRRHNAVFVTSAGGFEPSSPPSRILRLDPATLAPQAEIALPRRGFGLRLDDERGRLYVGHALDGAVSVVDIETGSVRATLQLTGKMTGENAGGRPAYHLREVALSADGSQIFLPGLGLRDSVLYVVRTSDFTVQAVVTGLGAGATGVTQDPRDGRVFVSTLAGRLYTIDPARGAIVNDVEAGGAEQPLNLAYDAAAGQVLAVDQGADAIKRSRAQLEPGFVSKHPGNRVVAIDPGSGALKWEVPTGEAPIALLADTERRRLFVTQRGAGSMLALDLDQHTPIATVPLPIYPNSMALDAGSGAVFVTIKNPREQATANEAVARVGLG